MGKVGNQQQVVLGLVGLKKLADLAEAKFWLVCQCPQVVLVCHRKIWEGIMIILL